jgi:hypothetical protein
LLDLLAMALKEAGSLAFALLLEEILRIAGRVLVDAFAISIDRLAPLTVLNERHA